MRLEKEYKYKLAGITIRRYVDSRFWYDIKEYLVREWHLKKYRKRNVEKWSRIIKRVSIDMRPLYISNPWEVWHYECDFIESIRGDKTSDIKIDR